jgi:hypothetical protein
MRDHTDPVKLSADLHESQIYVNETVMVIAKHHCV